MSGAASSELNPNSKLPVLVDGDFVLWESCAIMQYLCDITPGQTLYPQDARQRADVNRWLFWTSQHFAPALRRAGLGKRLEGQDGQGRAGPVALARGAAEIATLARADGPPLAGRGWVMGETLTLADFALATPLIYIEQARLPVTGCVNMMAWYGRVAGVGSLAKGGGGDGGASNCLKTAVGEFFSPV